MLIPPLSPRPGIKSLRTFPLNEPFVADTAFQQHELDPEAAIVGEIAVRFIELRELTGCDRPVSLLRHLIAVRGHRCFWTLIEMMTGNLDSLVRSYAERGAESGTTKQNAQQNLARALGRMAKVTPGTAQAIRELLRPAARNARLHPKATGDEHDDEVLPIVAPVEDEEDV